MLSAEVDNHLSTAGSDNRRSPMQMSLLAYKGV